MVQRVPPTVKLLHRLFFQEVELCQQLLKALTDIIEYIGEKAIELNWKRKKKLQKGKGLDIYFF